MNKRSNLKVMASLIGLVKPLMGWMIIAITMGVIGHLCASFITILGAYGILMVGGMPGHMPISVIFGCVLTFAIVRGFLRYAEQSCNHYIAFKLLALIRHHVFVALRKLTPAKLEGKDKGNLIAMITSDIELLEVFYAHTISPIFIAIIFSCTMSGFVMHFHKVLGWICLVSFFVVGAIVPSMINKLSKDDGMKFRTKSGELSSFILDSLRGLSEIIQYNVGQERLHQMNFLTDSLSSDEKRMKDVVGINQALTQSVILLCDLVMIFVGGTLYLNHEITFASLVCSIVTLMSSFGPVVALASLGSTLQNTMAAGNRVLDILEETPQVEDVKGKQEASFGDLDVHHVTFAYDDQQVLKDANYTFKKHQMTGLVGPSGCGKSTLLKLLMRFWETQKGDITINKTNINQINTTDLRNMESLMSQQTHLFSDSILNNIKIAKLDATNEEVIEACKKASIHDFIMSLPQGYETKVAELGDSLSGGEKQRIGLARAFLHNADLMLLDEPTSNLDSLNEAIILKSLVEARNNQTIIMVSHRPSVMKIADVVYEMNKDEI